MRWFLNWLLKRRGDFSVEQIAAIERREGRQGWKE
jgi:hypothetical protein